jgi:hypothetical protein
MYIHIHIYSYLILLPAIEAEPEAAQSRSDDLGEAPKRGVKLRRKKQHSNVEQVFLSVIRALQCQAPKCRIANFRPFTHYD